MPLQLIEGVLRDVSTYIDTNINNKIDALNVEWAADGIPNPTIHHPKRPFHLSEVIEADGSRYPMIEILGVVSSVMAEDASYMDSSHRFAIIVTIEDDISLELLRLRVYRYARVIIELMREYRSAGNGHIVNFGSPAVDYSPAVRRRNSSTVLADCLVNLEIVAAEVV